MLILGTYVSLWCIYRKTPIAGWHLTLSQREAFNSIRESPVLRSLLILELTFSPS